MTETTAEQRSPQVAGTLIGIGFCHYCVVGWKMSELGGKPVDVINAAITLVPAAAPIPGPGGQMVGMGVVAVPVCFEHVPVGRPAGQSLLLATMRGA